jgi:energy-coupling factor transporter transmembrane protein EcfT
MTGAFAYEHRDTTIHRLDARVKLISLAAFSIAAVAVDPWASRAVLAAALLGGYLGARASPLRALSGARLFLVLAAAMVVSHGFAGGTFTAAGAERGARVAAGFLLVVLAAELTLTTTPTARVTDSIHWLLRPVPVVNAGRTALMAGLAIRHAVSLGRLHREITDAMSVRGVRARRTPLRAMRIIAVSLLRETILEAERTVDALAARGYADERTPPSFAAGRRELLGALTVCAVIAAAVSAGRWLSG